MPSLKVSRTALDSKDKNTYFYFYYDLTRNSDVNGRSFIISFFSCLFMCISISMLIYISSNAIVDYIFSKDNMFALNHNIYYVQVTVLVIYQFIVCCTIMLLFLNQYFYHTIAIKQILIISFVINVLISGTIFYLFTFQYFVKTNTMFIFNQLCNFSHIHFVDCQIAFSLNSIYFGCIFHPISLLFTIVLCCVLNCICHTNKTTKIRIGRIQSNSKTKDNTQSRLSLFVHRGSRENLIDFYQINRNNEPNIHVDRIDARNGLFSSVYVHCTCILFCVLFGLV